MNQAKESLSVSRIWRQLRLVRFFDLARTMASFIRSASLSPFSSVKRFSSSLFAAFFSLMRRVKRLAWASSGAAQPQLM